MFFAPAGFNFKTLLLLVTIACGRFISFVQHHIQNQVLVSDMKTFSRFTWCDNRLDAIFDIATYSAFFDIMAITNQPITFLFTLVES